MRYITGDLVELALAGEFEVIAHGCNCFCAMGAGIASQIKQQFPATYAADCKTVVGDREKCGTCSEAEIIIQDQGLTVINCYIQYHWEGEGDLVDYRAFEKCMLWIHSRYGDRKIGLPRIGAGLAGGDWKKVETIIQKVFSGSNVSVVVREDKR